MTTMIMVQTNPWNPHVMFEDVVYSFGVALCYPFDMDISQVLSG
jgi:hypothetical protein